MQVNGISNAQNTAAKAIALLLAIHHLLFVKTEPQNTVLISLMEESELVLEC